MSTPVTRSYPANVPVTLTARVEVHKKDLEKAWKLLAEHEQEK